MKKCNTCHWSQWTVEKPPCKQCQEVGAFHKWKQIVNPPKPVPVYIGHRDGSE